jgi:hypothetical protein
MKINEILSESIDVGFEKMMGKMTSKKALHMKEALGMIQELYLNYGATYEEALDQASTSFEIDKAVLDAEYKKQEQGVAEGSNEVDYPVELNADIINWIKKTYPTATVAQLRDKSWLADKVKAYHREPKVLSGVRQKAQDAGRLEESMLEETYDGDEFYEAYGDLWYDEEMLNEAEYQGRNVQLGKPMRGDVKKFKVYVKDPSTGNVKKVNFGDPNMKIRKSNPGARKSFRARHNCDNPGPRTKARYWSCRKW